MKEGERTEGWGDGSQNMEGFFYYQYYSAESSAKANQNIKQIFLDLITLVKKKQGASNIESKGRLF
jgi:hypothetical protein